MGMLVKGVWYEVGYDTSKSNGQFIRNDPAFRNWITADGSPGPTGKGGFKAEAGRYHLYVSHACPWAHRAVIFRVLKGLENIISLSVVDHLMLDKGWEFSNNPGTIPDPVFSAKTMAEIYVKASPTYTGRVTVPVLWDTQTGTIVSNESSEIIRMFNSAFDGLTGSPIDFYPDHLRAEIDAVNNIVYHKINNGVYKAGFATSPEAYKDAVEQLFGALDQMETRLSDNPFLTGKTLTEADWRLFVTLIRFDAVYVGHFKCNIRRIADYDNLFNYLKALYQAPYIAKTVNMDHIKRHYYESHRTINPTAIVPVGPELDLGSYHNRSSITFT